MARLSAPHTPACLCCVADEWNRMMVVRKDLRFSFLFWTVVLFSLSSPPPLFAARWPRDVDGPCGEGRIEILSLDRQREKGLAKAAAVKFRETVLKDFRIRPRQ